MSRRVKMIFLSLLIASVAIQGYSIYAYAKVDEGKRVQYYCYKVEPLDHVPENYWNLTDPDPYISEAIQHPGEWTEPFYWEDSTFWFTAIWDDHPEIPGPRFTHPVPFVYNGTYYDYGVIYPGKRLHVTILDYEPEEYWNLTDPDKYLLEAIENPGKMIVVGVDSESRIEEILGPYSFPSTYKPFYYNGNYYDFCIGEIDYGYPLPIRPFKPEMTASILGTAWVAVGSIYILKNRKKKAKP